MSRSMPHGSAPDQMTRPDGARKSRGSCKKTAICSAPPPGQPPSPCYLRKHSYSYNVPLQDEQRKRRRDENGYI